MLANVSTRNMIREELVLGRYSQHQKILQKLGPEFVGVFFVALKLGALTALLDSSSGRCATVSTLVF